MDPSHALDPSRDDAVGPRPAGRPHASTPRIHNDFDPTVISASCLLVGATALILLANLLISRKKEH